VTGELTLTLPTWGEKIEGGFFEEKTHTYRDDEGIVRISSTQVFDTLGMVDFGNAKPEVVDFKRMYGQALHKCVQFLVAEDLDWDEVDNRLIDPVTGVESYLRELQFKVEGSEEKRIHNLCGMKYGMTLDLRGTVMYQGIRRHAVIDLKTGVKTSPTWTWQLGSYIHPQPKVERGWLGIIFQVHPDGRVIPHYVRDVEKAKREFQILLAAAILKVNEGFVKVGKP
jgi:hypothetical protein